MKSRGKKIVSVVLAVALTLLSVCTYTDTKATAYAAENDTITIHYKSAWGGANIFYWNQGVKYNNPVCWPGVSMTEEGDGWYQYSFDSTETVDFMLNYGGKQTTHYTKTTGEYWLANDQWYEYHPQEEEIKPTAIPTKQATAEPTKRATATPTTAVAATDMPSVTETPVPTEGLTEVFLPIRVVTPTMAPEVTVAPTEKEIKVHFWNQGEAANIYYWNVSGGTNTPVAWPGEEMTAEGNGWYSYTISPAKSAKIIFVTQNKETEESRIAYGEYWFVGGSWYDEKPQVGGEETPTKEPTKTPVNPTEVPVNPTETPIDPTEEPVDPTPTNIPVSTPELSKVPTEEPTKGPTSTPRPVVKGKIVVHFANKGTTVPTIYYWERNGDESDKPVTWPGVPMEADTVEGWYTFTFEDTTSTNLIFVSASGKTNDLSQTEGEWWFSGGKWYDYDLSAVTPTPKPTRKPTVTKGPTATPVPYDRTDFRDDTIYFVMTTRFYDGDPDNNVHCWDDGQAGNPDDDPAWRGDFKGLIERLDYIKALGFTAIWITPVVENTSGYDYHGYHASDFSKVDSRYESDDCTYQDLINAVHAKGMKIIQDVVFNHTGNFGEANLVPMFSKEGDQSTSECLQIVDGSALPDNYEELTPDQQYQARLALMKNTDGEDHDTDNLYHHYGNFNWDEYDSQLAQIAGDCVDLNTENPLVYNYLIDCYTQYINMGVDAFRVDTAKHISRLTFNMTFNKAFMKAGGENFFMFGEVCARDRNVWYRNTPGLSTPFYTWAETKDYGWSEDPADALKNVDLTETHFDDNRDIGTQPTSDNALLRGNEYHEPDRSQFSGLSVIDFPMHWNFNDASSAFGVAVGGDKYYNDATWNVTYVDSHDYAPDCAPESQRFAGNQETWAENLNLMFTFRGIPCIYYGSEVEFMKGAPIDVGPNAPLSTTGRAYFGENLEGTVTATDFGEYTATGTVADTLNHPLSLHIQRLNKIRAAIPALRKGQYSTEGVRGGMAFKRRYTNASEGIDSFVCVAITDGATFSGIPNGTYVDAITGTSKTVSDGTLTIEATGKGNMRVYVLSTSQTAAPGKVGADGKYLK